MSSVRRRSELDEMERAAEEARAVENWRMECLSMSERISEADCSESVKDILLLIAEAAGIDLWKSGGD